MAHTADITKLHDGDRSAVFHVFIKGDGASPDLSKLTLIDPNADLSPKLGKRPSLTITALWYSLAGFSARLEFDYLNDETGIWALAQDNPAELCFDSFGGIKDRSPVDGTGKIMLTTSGLVSGSGSIIIKVRKD
jgi:hypothetical protein